MRTTALVLGFLSTVLLSSTHAISIDWVPVRDPGNAHETTGFGGVSTTFSISTSEVTNAQYAAFLNTVDPVLKSQRELRGDHVPEAAAARVVATEVVLQLELRVRREAIA
ncbi:MAG: hypothetical protein QOE70_634, partial [Chthoniobacter sp.]|nr:hypothetical protein [Chthoniobacter sp.]